MILSIIAAREHANMHCAGGNNYWIALAQKAVHVQIIHHPALPLNCGQVAKQYLLVSIMHDKEFASTYA